LNGHTLLQVYPSADDRSAWLDANKLRDINPDTGLQLESYDVALTSAAQGIGIALGQQPYISMDLQTNALVEIFPEHRVANPNSWYFVCRKEKSQQKKLEIFREWLLQEIREDQTLSLNNGH
jgi:LysR family glycine cleavage system transcriptional activator